MDQIVLCNHKHRVRTIKLNGNLSITMLLKIKSLHIHVVIFVINIKIYFSNRLSFVRIPLSKFFSLREPVKS